MEAPGCPVGLLMPRFEDVRRIAVLRGGGLGDLLFALPAVEALAAAYPDAEVTLLGTALHAELLGSRPSAVDHVEEIPKGAAGPGQVDVRALDRFLAQTTARGVDLAVQLHGGGRQSNPLVLGLGARHTVGSGTPDAAPLERTLPFVYYQHEVVRALEVASLAGAPAVVLTPRLTVTAEDLARATEALGRASAERPLLVIHPGARDPLRRWDVHRFALVARWAAEDGFDVVVVGDPSDTALGDRLVDLATDEAAAATAKRARVHRAGAWGPDPGRRLHELPPPVDGPGTIRSMAGRLDLSGLVGVLALATVMLGNDSGPRHLAQAVGTRTVSIFWIGNVVNAAPVDRGRHRLHIGWVTRCPVCGRDVTGLSEETCDHEFELSPEVRPQDVYADVLALAEEAADHGQDPSVSGQMRSSRTSQP
ncbi:MAG TPA: glycosyltransferase family 9 protein [Propionibacteriaceae bacterium]|nr:glycosyltransferase family 9 protein [Propionibacteriaceae bacterium]